MHVRDSSDKYQAVSHTSFADLLRTLYITTNSPSVSFQPHEHTLKTPTVATMAAAVAVAAVPPLL